jgi:co-chaperonin GroES (HSP10)
MIQPIKHRILVQRDAPKEVTAGGLVIPEEAQKRETRGYVIARGSSADPDIEVGYRVVFGYHDGFAVDPKYCDDKENCWMIADNQVRAILHD